MDSLIDFEDPLMDLLSRYGFKLVIFNKYYFRLQCLNGFIILLNIMAETIFFCKSKNPLQQLLEYGPMYGIEINIFGAIILLFVNKEKIIHIGYTKIVKNTAYIKHLSPKQEAHIRYQGKLTDYAYIYQFLSSLLFVLTALLFDNTVPNEERFLYWAILSQSNIPIVSNRYFLFLYGLYINIMGAHAFVMALYCFIYFASHIRFCVLAFVEQIDNMTKKMEDNRLGIELVDNADIQKHLKNELRKIISRHADLIRFNTLMQSFMSTPCTVYTSLLLLSSIGFLILLLTKKIGIVFGLVGLANYIGVGSAGFFGQIYTDNFESIYESACKMAWYLWDEGSQRNYSIFLNLAAKPRQIYFMFSTIAVNHRLVIQFFQKIYGGANIFYTLMKKNKQF